MDLKRRLKQKTRLVRSKKLEKLLASNDMQNTLFELNNGKAKLKDINDRIADFDSIQKKYEMQPFNPALYMSQIDHCSSLQEELSLRTKAITECEENYKQAQSELLRARSKLKAMESGLEKSIKQAENIKHHREWADLIHMRN